MGLGNKTAASIWSERAMAVNPIEKDAFGGPAPFEILARVAARMGEPDRAIAAIEKLLSIPMAAHWARCAAHSRAPPARSDVRSAPKRSSLSKTGERKTVRVGGINEIHTTNSPHHQVDRNSSAVATSKRDAKPKSSSAAYEGRRIISQWLQL